LLRVGSGAGLRDLTTASRQTWMKLNGPDLMALTRTIPVVCCASYINDRATWPDRRYLHLAGWVERRGRGRNDGLVPVASALLPGARHVVVKGAHRGAVASGRDRDPVALLRRLLTLALLEQSSARPAA
jgi:hypothetical protein